MTALTKETPFIELLLKITRSSTAFLNDAPSKLALTAAGAAKGRPVSEASLVKRSKQQPGCTASQRP